MYQIVRLYIFLIGLLPLELVQAFGSFIGRLAWYVLPGRRKVATINACIVGAENPKKTAKLSFRHTFMSYFETACIENVDAAFIQKYVSHEGDEHFEALRGKGVYMFSAHLGSWDLLTPVCAYALNASFLVVGRASNSGTLNRLLLNSRNTDKVAYVFDRGFMDKIKEYTDAGYITGSLLDHLTTSADGIRVPFFGYSVETTAAAAAYCVRRKIPLLPSYLVRKEKGFHLITRPPLYLDNSLKVKERIEDLCVRINKEFEEVIRQYPEQWYLLHRRFKRVGKGNGKKNSSLY